ncbi:uncharacterized protein LOC131939283 [Physella acuta]|uniref:uncharacterized protein LOC131939283 n=1 Tax=Physella acuta TaxID=109671 RepID=UPI0027DE726A|nr:uncharacterized protein LOC131939283 [Physella acuta]
MEFALSLTTAVSLVMNIVMGIVIYWVVTKNRRLTRQKTRPALNVDILKRGPFPTPDPHPESIAVEGLTRQISTGFEREANNNDTEETAYSDIDQVQNEIAKSSLCSDGAGDTQTLTGPRVVSDGAGDTQTLTGPQVVSDGAGDTQTLTGPQVVSDGAGDTQTLTGPQVVYDGAGDTQTLTDPQVVSDAVAPPAPIVSNQESTYNHLRINNGLITHVDTVYGDNSAN